MILPRTRDELVRVLDICLTGGVPCEIVGNGSDLLVGDRGLRGACILLRDNYSDMTVAGNRIRAAAGALLRDVALTAADAGLSGLEPLWGIPATVGRVIGRQGKRGRKHDPILVMNTALTIAHTKLGHGDRPDLTACTGTVL